MMTILFASQTRGTPISAKLFRTRSAFSCESATSTPATTISSGSTEVLPDARARIFSASVIGIGVLPLPRRGQFGRRAVFVFHHGFGQVLVLLAPVIRQADERRVLGEGGEPLILP